jgi:polyketide biosynthesis enoyl-CoA hydratase PksI
VVRVSHRDHVAVVTLDDPASHNALGEAMVTALTQALDRAGRDTTVHAIVLAASGPTFSAGAPAEFLTRLADGDLRSSDLLLPRALLECPVPIVSAMAGQAVGGGFTLGLSADVVCLARERRYGFSFMNLGFTPGMGTTALCEHVLAPAIAHELMYSGEMRRGAEFARTGVNHVVPQDEVEPRALDVAARIAEKPRVAVEALKRTLALPRRRAFDAATALETLMHQITLGAPGAVSRIQAGYVE